MNNQQIGIMVFLIIVMIYLTVKLYLYKNIINEKYGEELDNKKFTYPDTPNEIRERFITGDIVWDSESYQVVKIMEVEAYPSNIYKYLIVSNGKPTWVSNSRLWSFDLINKVKEKYEISTVHTLEV